MTARHPIFARVFHRLSGLMERDLGPRRDELLAGLAGRVAELGAGNGMNFPHYPGGVAEVVAVEPEPYLRAKAQEAAARAPAPIAVRDGVAEALPVDDASCDAAVACLVLCSVPSPARALAELRRVLKPAGELRFLEHVRAERGAKARTQDALDRFGVWPRLVGGCHCSRDTLGEIEAAGFRIERVERFGLGPSWSATHPHVLGVARPL
jgi:SAM-dependent methyltransferase